MQPQIFSSEFGPIDLVEGMPGMLAKHLLPSAHSYYSAGRFGTLCLQILQTDRQLLYYFLFQLSQRFSFSFLNPMKGLQSVINLAGQFRYRVDGSEEMVVRNSEYLLYAARQEVFHTTVEPGKLSSYLHIYFSEAGYAPLLSLFPDFSRQLAEQQARPFAFFQGPTIVPPAVRDSVQSILHDRYALHLQQKHIELHLERTLFEQLVKGMKQHEVPIASDFEKEKAMEASHLLLGHLRRQWTVDEVAGELHCTTAWLKKAFHKMYGTGVYHYLRRARMEKAKELFQKGESLKAVAVEVGMKPHNFPKEFKAYFGYTVTQFKQSLH